VADVVDLRVSKHRRRLADLADFVDERHQLAKHCTLRLDDMRVGIILQSGTGDACRQSGLNGLDASGEIA
jgi:hypothetical protein